MKKLVLLVAIATTLMSCDNYEEVKLSNGAVVKAFNSEDVSYREFTTVCVQSSKGKWYICSDGEMKDTSIVTVTGTIKHRIGKVSNNY